MRRNYATANRKTVCEVRAEVRNGSFRALLPAKTGENPLPAGLYIVKAYAWDEQVSAAAATQVNWSVAP
jgi:hypothetical protein